MRPASFGALDSAQPPAESRDASAAVVLGLTEDVLAAVDWHVAGGYAGREFLFSKTGEFPRYIDSHVRPLKFVQLKLGLRALSHHKVGRHSVASQAVTSGESVKAVQAQLGHRSEQSMLITGDTGSGKSVLARFIHDPSSRSAHPFLQLNRHSAQPRRERAA